MPQAVATMTMTQHVPDTETTAGAEVGRDLVGLERRELAAVLAELGVPEAKRRMRANQLWLWIYKRGAADFSEMSNLGKDLRGLLEAGYRIGRPTISLQQTSTDGTRKYLLRFDDGNEAETVFIPEKDRGALCVSSQIGCTLTCRFCHTGTQRLVRNLEAREIVHQMMVARDDLGEWSLAPRAPRRLTNIVMMGMGEPLYNYDAVAKALKIIMDGEGMALSKRKITLSTAGVVPLIDRAGEDLGVKLAVSLHAVRDEVRDILVPINRKHPIRELIAACRRYPTGNARRITFEYVMLKGINDSPGDAKELVRLIAGIPAKVNLIPFNPWPGSTYECSAAEVIARFAEIVNNAGYAAPVRAPRGRDIMAACGQLKSASERTRKQRMANSTG